MDRRPRRTLSAHHSIRSLLGCLAELGAVVAEFEDLDGFTPYAVTFRYEGVVPGSTPIDREEVIARLEALLGRVKTTI